MKRDRQRQREEKVIATVTAPTEQESVEEGNEEVKRVNDNAVDHDDSEMRVPHKSPPHDGYICPCSLSFRVYCMEPISADPNIDTDECELPSVLIHHSLLFKTENDHLAWRASKHKPTPVQ